MATKTRAEAPHAWNERDAGRIADSVQFTEKFRRGQLPLRRRNIMGDGGGWPGNRFGTLILELAKCATGLAQCIEWILVREGVGVKWERNTGPQGLVIFYVVEPHGVLLPAGTFVSCIPSNLSDVWIPVAAHCTGTCFGEESGGGSEPPPPPDPPDPITEPDPVPPPDPDECIGDPPVCVPPGEPCCFNGAWTCCIDGVPLIGGGGGGGGGMLSASSGGSWQPLYQYSQTDYLSGQEPLPQPEGMPQYPMPVYPPPEQPPGTIDLQTLCAINAENWRQRCRLEGYDPACCDAHAAAFLSACIGGRTAFPFPVETPEQACGLITATGPVPRG